MMNKSKRIIFIFTYILAWALIMLIVSGCSTHLKTPVGWTVEKTGERPCCNPFGLYNAGLKRIKVMPPKWAPQKITTGYILDHELGHAWGIKGCKHMYCIMYEPSARGHKEDNIFFEALAKPLQLMYGLRFCKECKKYLKNKGAFK